MLQQNPLQNYFFIVTSQISSLIELLCDVADSGRQILVSFS
jgi:hypothetical protein